MFYVSFLTKHFDLFILNHVLTVIFQLNNLKVNLHKLYSILLILKVIVHEIFYDANVCLIAYFSSNIFHGNMIYVYIYMIHHN
jgi:hypothetical protein